MPQYRIYFIHQGVRGSIQEKSVGGEFKKMVWCGGLSFLGESGSHYLFWHSGYSGCSYKGKDEIIEVPVKCISEITQDLLNLWGMLYPGWGFNSVKLEEY